MAYDIRAVTRYEGDLSSGHFSFDPNDSSQDTIPPGDARRSHEDWRYNVLTPKESAHVTDANDFGDTVSLSRLAINMAIKSQRRSG
jgi:hypothetical protein|tara:strand:- start:91 stop:348 length:258 start_codon:yes stop_codon:yes gene_type:complete